MKTATAKKRKAKSIPAAKRAKSAPAKAARAKPAPAKPAPAKPAPAKHAPAKPARGDVNLSKIGLVILYVRDPLASLPFYRDVLGMNVVEESPEWVQLDGGGTHLALHPHPSIPADRGTACSWVVFEVDDVRGAYEGLRKRGVAFLCEPKQVCGDAQRAGLSADFKDADGNPLSLFGYVSLP